MKMQNLYIQKIQEQANTIEIKKENIIIKKKITEELSNLGYNFKYKGTYYLLETIMTIYEHGSEELLDNLEANVYKIIAYKNNKTINNIKTNIIKATSLAYICQKENKINEYFGFEIKPTPKVVISTVIQKILLQELYIS